MFSKPTKMLDKLPRGYKIRRSMSKGQIRALLGILSNHVDPSRMPRIKGEPTDAEKAWIELNVSLMRAVREHREAVEMMPCKPLPLKEITSQISDLIATAIEHYSPTEVKNAIESALTTRKESNNTLTVHLRDVMDASAGRIKAQVKANAEGVDVKILASDDTEIASVYVEHYLQDVRVLVWGQYDEYGNPMSTTTLVYNTSNFTEDDNE